MMRNKRGPEREREKKKGVFSCMSELIISQGISISSLVGWF